MKNVEDIYPVSPMQAVMLLHVHSARGDDVLFNQFVYQITGALDSEAFACAWQQLIERHPVFRTCFVSEGLQQPMQVVRRQAKLPYRFVDMAHRQPDAQQSELDTLLESDRQQGFDIARAPLMRVALVRLSEEAYRLVWSSHHLIVDRWCLGVIFADLFELYRAQRRGQRPELGPVKRYRDYIAWIGKQSRNAAEAHWREALAGLQTGTTITRPAASTGSSTAEPVMQRLALPSDLAGGLRAMTRGQGLTLGVLVQSAWALTIARITGRSDVVIGVTVSGRPPELVGVESMVGSFISNLPVRIRIDTDQPLLDWLKQNQTNQQRRIPFEYVSLADIYNWSALPAGEPLFDSLLIWHAGAELDAPQELVVRGVSAPTATAYPHTLSISEARDSLVFESVVDGGSELAVAHEALLRRLVELLSTMAVARSDQTLGEVFGIAFDDGESTFSTARPTWQGPALSHGYHGVESDSAAPAGGRLALDTDHLHEMLQHEWRNLLGCDEVGLDDDFFDLGGNSLSAARLHADIELHTRLTVPLIALFREPTIRQMARLLHGQDWPLKTGTVIPVRPGGTRLPLFCVAAPDVNTIGYASLVRHLDPDVPLFILQLPPDSSRHRRLAPSEMSQIAASYIEALSDIQPRGPYHLLGMCTGAQLAVEMANQLQDGGKQVAFLAVVDTWAYFTFSRFFYLVRVLNRLRYYRKRFAELAGLGLRQQLATVGGVLRQRLRRTPAVSVPASTGAAHAAAIVADNRGGGSGDQTASPGGDPWIDEYGWAHRAREMPKFDGRLVLFRLCRHRQQRWRIRDAGLGWGRFATDLEIETLPGTEHVEIFREPRIADIAQRIQKRLDAVAGEQPGAEADNNNEEGSRSYA